MGVGAAVVMPAALSLLVATFPRSERVKAVRAWTATSGLAVAVGPLVAGGGPQQAQAVVDAVHQAFAHGVARTSLIGGSSWRPGR